MDEATELTTYAEKIVNLLEDKGLSYPQIYTILGIGQTLCIDELTNASEELEEEDGIGEEIGSEENTPEITTEATPKTTTETPQNK